MINPAENLAGQAEEICLRPKLSPVAKSDANSRPMGNGSGDDLVRLLCLNLTDRARQRAARRVEVSLRYMIQHLNQPMKVSVLSAMVGLSESSFFALFKCATGLTPLDFFIRLRMQRAAGLLTETTLQIKEIAARLGYDDQFYFSRLFKAVHGLPPREYRAQRQEATHADLKLQSTTEPLAMSEWLSVLPRLALIGSTPMNERAVRAVFPPGASAVKPCPGGRREAVTSIGPTRSVSVS